MKKLFFMLIFLWLILSCSNEDNPSLQSIDGISEFSQFTEKINSSNFPIIYDIIDADNKSIGSIEILDDTDYLFVTCKTGKDLLFTDLDLYAGAYKLIPETNGIPSSKNFPFKSKLSNPSKQYLFTIQKDKIVLDSNECIYLSMHSKITDTNSGKTIQGWSSSQILPGTGRNKLVLYCVRNESIALNIP